MPRLVSTFLSRYFRRNGSLLQRFNRSRKIRTLDNRDRFFSEPMRGRWACAEKSNSNRQSRGCSFSTQGPRTTKRNAFALERFSYVKGNDPITWSFFRSRCDEPGRANDHGRRSQEVRDLLKLRKPDPLIAPIYSLFEQKKFPVLLRREFRGNTWNLLRNRRLFSDLG